jgi:ribosome biogenesis GTPase A
LKNVPSSKITDYGVKELVTHAIHLRYINLSWNLKIKDLALQSIIRHSTEIVRIKLDGTSVTHIPASIIQRKQTLREVSLSMCKDLVPAATATALQTAPGVMAYIEEMSDRNLNYRLKVFFLGATGTGKSELIRALIGKTDVLEELTQEGKVGPSSSFQRRLSVDAAVGSSCSRSARVCRTS